MWGSLRLESRLIGRDRGAVVTARALALILIISFASRTRADEAETAARRFTAEKVQAEWKRAAAAKSPFCGALWHPRLSPARAVAGD